MSFDTQLISGAVAGAAIALGADLIETGTSVADLEANFSSKLVISPEVKLLKKPFDAILCNYNPSSIKVRRTTGWKNTPVQHLPVPKKSFGSGGNTEIVMSLMFRDDDVERFDPSKSPSGIGSIGDRLGGLVAKLPLASEAFNAFNSVSTILNAGDIAVEVDKIKAQIISGNTLAGDKFTQTQRDIMNLMGSSYNTFTNAGLSLLDGPPVLKIFFGHGRTFRCVLTKLDFDFVQFSKEMLPMRVMVNITFEQYMNVTEAELDSHERMGASALGWLFRA